MSNFISFQVWSAAASEQKMSKLCLVLVTVAGILFKTCSPYSMGAPDQACKSMTPGHGFDPQDGDPPIKLELSTKGDILPGGHVDVKLVAPDSSNAFKGETSSITLLNNF